MGFLVGLGNAPTSGRPPSAAPNLGSSDVQGTTTGLDGVTAPSTTSASDPMSQLIAMRQTAISQASASDLASKLSGSGVINNPTNYGQDNYAPPAPSGGAVPASAPISGSAPSGPINSPADAARAVLAALGDNPTQADVNSMVNWYGHEGGNWHNTAYYNPWNTTQAYDGSTPMNSVGVQAYKNWADGIAATVQTLRNGYYNDILSALASGNGLQGHLSGLGKWSGGAYYSA